MRNKSIQCMGKRKASWLAIRKQFLMLHCTLTTKYTLQSLTSCLTLGIREWLCFDHVHTGLLLTFIPQEWGFYFMQNLQTERINLFLCLLPWRGFLEGIYLFSSFLSFLYKCLLPLSPSPQLVYSGNKNLTLTLRSLVFQTVQSAESKEKNRCVPY